VLFCGVPSEPPLSRAIAAAEELGLSYSLFNQRATHAMEIELALQAGQVGGRLCLPTGKVKLESFDGLYLRLMGWESLPENQNATPPQREKSRLQHEALSDWADLAPHRVCNRPSAMASNFSKPYQAQFIERSGLATPPTLVTNEPDALRQFVKEHRRVIYKSVSSVRSIVREIGPVELTRLDKLRSLPTQFQAYIPGVNWRVHVVGQHLFATRIESEAVDYRYAQRDGHEIEMRALALPDEIAERCLSLSALLSLPFCGIDLKQTPEGQFYCFEVNPSPAYTYYQAHTGQPIAQALTRWLAYGES
jgi:hypothetical protein